MVVDPSSSPILDDDTTMHSFHSSSIQDLSPNNTNHSKQSIMQKKNDNLTKWHETTSYIHEDPIKHESSEMDTTLVMQHDTKPDKEETSTKLETLSSKFTSQISALQTLIQSTSVAINDILQKEMEKRQDEKVKFEVLMEKVGFVHDQQLKLMELDISN